MPLLALGLNHKTAPISIREMAVFNPKHIRNALQELLTVPTINEAAIISTCNRTEIYCELNNPNHDNALKWFIGHHGLHNMDHSAFFYHFHGKQSVQHLLKVACGLDSMVLGEPQILGQLKSAYHEAAEAGTIGKQLNKLFQYTFSVAKQIRSDTDIGAHPVSVAFTAVQLAKQIFSDLSQQTAIMIGAGETIELVARHLVKNNIGKLLIANRSLEKASALAKQFNGQPLKLAELTEHLPKADILISSTASQLPIIGKGAVESALKTRKHRPIFMIDIAVPRDVEPEVSTLEDVYLYNIDDLNNVINKNQQSRKNAAKQAENIIDIKAEEFTAWQRSLHATDTIRRYREDANTISLETLENAKKQLASGKPAEEVLEHLTHSLTNKLLHGTTVRLDQAARDGQQELLKAAAELLKIDPD